MCGWVSFGSIRISRQWREESSWIIPPQSASAVRAVAVAGLHHIGNQIGGGLRWPVFAGWAFGEPARRHFDVFPGRDNDLLRHMAHALIEHHHHRHAENSSARLKPVIVRSKHSCGSWGKAR
jgi:hypothetical protein